MPKKGRTRKDKMAGSRLAYDDTVQEKEKQGGPAKAAPTHKTTKKGEVRKEAKGVAGSRLAFDDTVQEKTKKKGSPWMDHVKKTWAAGKKKDPSYKYKDAMRDAKATYK